MGYRKPRRNWQFFVSKNRWVDTGGLGIHIYSYLVWHYLPFVALATVNWNLPFLYQWNVNRTMSSYRIQDQEKDTEKCKFEWSNTMIVDWFIDSYTMRFFYMVQTQKLQKVPMLSVQYRIRCELTCETFNCLLGRKLCIILAVPVSWIEGSGNGRGAFLEANLWRWQTKS